MIILLKTASIKSTFTQNVKHTSATSFLPEFRHIYITIHLLESNIQETKIKLFNNFVQLLSFAQSKAAAVAV